MFIGYRKENLNIPPCIGCVSEDESEAEVGGRKVRRWGEGGEGKEDIYQEVSEER